jgi:hypothetical protein
MSVSCIRIINSIGEGCPWIVKHGWRDPFKTYLRFVHTDENRRNTSITASDHGSKSILPDIQHKDSTGKSDGFIKARG